MKKTLTINIAGFVFHIEEDAYSMLENYINSIHQYFKSFEGSKEIIDDIESRIAEKFFEIREVEKTEAISMIHVEQLIATLGTVADFKEYEVGETRDERGETREERRGSRDEKKAFRRDLTRKKIGGVAAGLANYFEVDPLWVRLIFVMGFLGLIPLLPQLSNAIFLGYIICWIAIPGENPEDKETTYKRFFRDPDNKVVGGVIAGIAKFTGWDLGLLRVLAVISIFVFGTGFLAYLIILAITPEAKTVTEKMAMEGEPITLENIEQNIQKSIQSENKAESIFAKILLFPFRIFAAILPAFKSVLHIVRWIVQYVIGGVLLICALAIFLGLTIASTVGVSGFDHGVIQVQFWEAIPIFLLRNDLPSWSVIAIIFAILPIVVSIGIGGLSLLANRKLHNKTFSYVSAGMSILGWIGIFYTITIVGGHFSRTAATNKVIEYVVSDSTKTIFLDVRKESQESIFEKMLGDRSLRDELLDDEELHDYNRNGFNRAQIELEGYDGNKIQIVQFFKSNGSTRPEAQQNANAIAYNVTQNQQSFLFDSHFGVKNKKFRNQRVKVKVLIPYGKTFSMTKDYAYFIENLIDAGYFDEEASSFKNAIWKFEKNEGLICLNRAIYKNRDHLGEGEQWEDFEKRFEEKENQSPNATY